MLNHEIPIALHNLKTYDSHLTMPELGKFNFKINVIPNGLEKYMSFNVIFIDSFQFLSSSLNSLGKNLGKHDFKYLSQEFDSKVLDLVQEKGLYPYEYVSNFKNFKEELPSKERFYSLFTGEKNSHKEYEHVLKVWNKFEIKAIKGYHDLYLKCNIILLADIFLKIQK